MAGIAHLKIIIPQILDTIIDDSESEELVDKFNALLKYAPGFFKQYEVISLYIYELEEERYKVLDNFFTEDKDYNKFSYQKFRGNLDISIKDSVELLDRFERHIKLACIQRKFILNNIKEADQVVKKITEKAEDTEKEMLDLKTKIYSEFIAILGIFTAISFALMGSIETFGTVFSRVDDPSSSSIGYAIIAGAVYLIIMIVLITVLFVGMQKVLKTRKEPFPWWTVNVSVFSILFLVITGIILLRM